MFLKYYRKKNVNFDKKIDFKDEEKNSYIFTNKNIKYIFGGKFYYFNSSSSKSSFFGNKIKERLGNLLKKYNLDNFVNNVEGEYFGIKIDYKNKSLTIFSDKLKQLELYYFYNKDIFILSENPKEIIDQIGLPDYEENSLISIMLLYVPKGHTLFKGIRRLKYNETIKISQNKISIESFEDKDTNISDYTDDDLLKYKKIVRNAILSRASNKFNLVFSSGGWDSNLLLSILKENLGKDKVGGITMKVIMQDGRCFNKFEVDKVKKISKALGVNIDIVEIDYRKKELSHKIDKVKNELFLKNLFFLAPANWSTAVDYIRKKYGKDVVVFHGEGSDSLQNYGFSQYISLLHDNADFRKYADKMKNYLFSPSFFKKIKNNDFLNDTVYKIFLNFNQDKEFTDVKNLGLKEKIFCYLMSFIFSDKRIPFRKVDCPRYVKEAAFAKFKKWLKKEYFQRAIENINESNLYYYFSYLYSQFHLQSPQVRIFRAGLKNVRFPYIDLNSFRFLFKMPENFGRGLDFNPTKYPLKTLAKEIFSETQLEAVESVPHSYLSEVEDINIYDEYLLKGSIYEYMKDKIDLRKVKKIFSNKIFNSKEIEKLIKNFKKGKLKDISEMEAKLLLVLTLLSVNSGL